MAGHQGIAATSQAVLGLLEGAAAGTEAEGGTFAHYRGGDFASPMDRGLSLYLHRIAVNASRRAAVRLPLDLHYLLTAWARDAVLQQRMLGWAAGTLAHHPTLPATLLNHYGPEPDVFEPHETVELLVASVSEQDAAEIWEIAKSQRQPSLHYIARIVEIEPREPLEEGAPVQVFEVGYAGGVR
jgi:hypothetical protein